MTGVRSDEVTFLCGKAWNIKGPDDLCPPQNPCPEDGVTDQDVYSAVFLVTRAQ